MVGVDPFDDLERGGHDEPGGGVEVLLERDLEDPPARQADSVERGVHVEADARGRLDDRAQAQLQRDEVMRLLVPGHPAGLEEPRAQQSALAELDDLVAVTGDRRRLAEPGQHIDHAHRAVEGVALGEVEDRVGRAGRAGRTPMSSS